MVSYPLLHPCQRSIFCGLDFFSQGRHTLPVTPPISSTGHCSYTLLCSQNPGNSCPCSSTTRNCACLSSYNPRRARARQNPSFDGWKYSPLRLKDSALGFACLQYCLSKLLEILPLAALEKGHDYKVKNSWKHPWVCFVPNPASGSSRRSYLPHPVPLLQI